MKLILQTPEVKASIHELEPRETGKHHLHSHVDEHLFCLEGQVDVALSDPKQNVSLRPGESVMIDKGRAHHVANEKASRASYLILQGVGPFDFVDVENVPHSG